jgi:ABC-type uncharacterized transport system substrate-binding protein
MKRREFISALGCAAAATWPLSARTQPAGQKIYRIGVLEQSATVLDDSYFGAFREALREHGYVEGQNLAIVFRSAERSERYRQLAAELVSLNVDVIVTRGTPAALAAKNATSTIPIVMAAIGDPAMVVTSVARPGGNVTGLSAFNSELEGKRVEVIRELVPGARRIAALYNMGNPIFSSRWQEFEKVANLLQIESQLLDVRRSADLEPNFEAATKWRADALVVSADGVLQANRRVIAELAAKQRLPAIYTSREFIEPGGLISYGVKYVELYRRAAAYVDRILKGAHPNDLPIEQPTRFELIVNLKSAKALGLDVPTTLLARADEVIE